MRYGVKFLKMKSIEAERQDNCDICGNQNIFVMIHSMTTLIPYVSSHIIFSNRKNRNLTWARDAIKTETATNWNIFTTNDEIVANPAAFLRIREMRWKQVNSAFCSSSLCASHIRETFADDD